MTANQPVSIIPDEILEGRPFTHPEHVVEERKFMLLMADSLLNILNAQPEGLKGSAPIVVLHGQEGTGWQRQIINRPVELSLGHPLTVVGFFGQKLDRMDLVQERNSLDQALISDFPNHPYLLSYSSLELPSGDFGNLVIFSRQEGKDHWSACPTHIRAVSELAPEYYASVRLYNGVLPRGLQANHALRLTCVKYYDYTASTIWRAQRQLQAARYAQ